ncbi:hypothetical protein E2C01_007644 [Portunus trituberculatus]|uniref:Uncharacterized protein n=1 Tax=Portunus trituberculatus TaxID=210409 RepID=A0A5B7CYN5_PORTR|nr:hypothetical protein [Portunus trituberculatus]
MEIKKKEGEELGEARHLSQPCPLDNVMPVKVTPLSPLCDAGWGDRQPGGMLTSVSPLHNMAAEEAISQSQKSYQDL